MADLFAVTQSLLAPAAIGAEVARAYDLPAPVRCTFLTPGINDTYRVEAGGTPYILRVYRAGWRTPAEIDWELALLRHLEQSGVAVSVPIARRDGTWRLEFAAPEGARQAVLFSFAPGKVLAYNEEDALRYGSLVADLHTAMDGFTTELPRFHLDREHLLEQPLRTIRPHAERHGSWEFYAREGARMGAQLSELEPLLTWGICHGDLHGHNVHQTEEHQLTLFDFDCGGPGLRAYDLAVYRWAVRMHARTAEPWEAFLRGYQSRRPLGQADLEAVPLFVRIRTLWLLGLYAGQVEQRGTAFIEQGLTWTVNTLQKWESS
ncbi:MAG TPA: phosphotransferase [Symbiobacteriaceae bacterium]|jgi:Ser/Thr protein kinase RdoA (MazF antagonist)|nr:phosphotransferase [Symbiobacteriaceae bacterium]